MTVPENISLGFLTLIKNRSDYLGVSDRFLLTIGPLDALILVFVQVSVIGVILKFVITFTKGWWLVNVLSHFS